MVIDLSAQFLDQLPPGTAVPSYDRDAVKVGIAHFGVGNFHRVHEAVYLDRCLHLPDHEGWGIVGVGLSDTAAARQKASALGAQNGLYSVTEFAPDGAANRRIVGALCRYMHAPEDPEAVLAQLSDPALRIVSLTITEGGYLIDESSGRFALDHPGVQHDLAAPLPKTVFGFIVRALARRRDSGIAPFTVVSCDNLRQNGGTTRRAVVSFAEALDPDLAVWISSEVAFPNSMVDRIAPYVSAEDRARLNAASGVEDALPVMSESYLQWVIEDRFPAGRPDLGAVGVELRDDVALYESVKGRMLNASHVLLSYVALLLGHRYVHEALADSRVRSLVDVYLTSDVIPLLQGPAGMSLPTYRDSILERFSNPAIRDQLIRIATDGSAKIPVFHSATLQTLLERGGDLRREALLLACYARYLLGVDDLGVDFEVAEPSLSDTDRTVLGAADGLGLLRISSLRALGLAENELFVDVYRATTLALREGGTDGAIAAAVAPVPGVLGSIFRADSV